jgi:rRNA pseudouridine-1189 N-methylase Emg1 (Nep1/Mra1 family)
VKEETEIKWIAHLLNNFSKNLKSINQISSECSAPKNSKEFRDWFKKLMKEGVFIFDSYLENESGSPTKLFKLNKVKLLNYLNTITLWESIYELAMEDEWKLIR